MSQFMHRRRITTALAGAALCAGLTATTGAATAVAAPASGNRPALADQFIAKLNAARESAGLRPYVVSSALTAVATRHSAAMSDKDELYHNPNLATDISDWDAVGENVGVGGTVSDVHNAFMQSPEHRANILDHDFTQVGVGVTVDESGEVWVTEDFREPAGDVSASRTTSPHRRAHHKAHHTKRHHAKKHHAKRHHAKTHHHRAHKHHAKKHHQVNAWSKWTHNWITSLRSRHTVIWLVRKA